MLLDPGFNLTLRPMKYPEFYEMYKNSIKNTWTVEEVDFSTDVMDLRNKMSGPERHMIKSDPTGKHCLTHDECCDRIDEKNRNCYRAQCYATSRAFARSLV